MWTHSSLLSSASLLVKYLMSLGILSKLAYIRDYSILVICLLNSTIDLFTESKSRKISLDLSCPFYATSGVNKLIRRWVSLVCCSSWRSTWFTSASCLLCSSLYAKTFNDALAVNTSCFKSLKSSYFAKFASLGSICAITCFMIFLSEVSFSTLIVG